MSDGLQLLREVSLNPELVPDHMLALWLVDLFSPEEDVCKIYFLSRHFAQCWVKRNFKRHTSGCCVLESSLQYWWKVEPFSTHLELTPKLSAISCELLHGATDSMHISKGTIR